MHNKYQLVNINFKKLLLLSLVFNLAQLGMIGLVITYALSHPISDLDLLIYISAGLTVFNSALTAFAYYFILYTKRNSIGETIKNLENLNSKLREQRHDYLNHIQVVHGLLELEEFEEAKKYIEPVYKDILKVNRALKTAHPAINALLQAKLQMAEQNGIDVYLDIKTNLAQINIEPWELCKVLSNIIDNGITALKDNGENKKLYITLEDQGEYYKMAIENNGPQIPDKFMITIFEEGFTTKNEEGHGMGLFIVRNIIEKMGGTVNT